MKTVKWRKGGGFGAPKGRSAGLTALSLATLAAQGCSAALDFSGTGTETEAGTTLTADAGMADAGEMQDAGAVFLDAAAEDGEVTGATDGGFSGILDGGLQGVGCDPRTHAGCHLEQLCCTSGPDQSPHCVATSGATQCAACGQPCSDPAAPYCGMRRCECAEGTGQACPRGAFCLGRGADARCAECASDADCADRPGASQCDSDLRCRPCVPSDCAGDTPYCATDPGPQMGSCVACRSDADCPQATPVCDETSGRCRTRAAADCAQGQVFEPASGTCVACLVDAHCEDTPERPVCTSGHVCGECVIDADCPDPSSPLCSPATHTCTACDVMEGSADARCQAKRPGTHCVTQGDHAGTCQICEARRPLGQLYHVGCSFERPVCLTLDDEPPSCHGCDPNAGRLACLLGECARVDQAYQCVELGHGGSRGRGNASR